MQESNIRLTDASFKGKKLLIIVDLLSTANQRTLADAGLLAQDLSQANVETWVFTAEVDNVKGFLDQSGIDLPIYAVDATVLKAMIRSNPGVMVLENGTVKGKWHYNDWPTATQVLQKL